MATKDKKVLEKVVIRFAGDSGDGMQLTGSQFADTSMIVGNDIVTFPDYPAEIRAPQGTVAGVSSFQVQIGKVDVYTPGDWPDVLVAMNPAALKANLHLLKEGSTVITDVDAYDKKNLEKAGYDANPLDNGISTIYNIVPAPITSLTRSGIAHLGLDNKSMNRCKNMFALGVVYWLFSRPLEPTEAFLDKKFKSNPVLAEANKLALRAGHIYAESIELLPSAYIIPSANLEKGRYRNVTGNRAIAWGFMAAAEKAGKPLFLGSYPITPASDIMHELAKQKAFDVRVFQAEDEIAAMASTIGASFAGNIAVTNTSGPGLCLKSEAIGLAVMSELPVVIVNVQRGGPSTGLPTKTEQSDLLQAMYGRNGESPVVVMAASMPNNCFSLAFEAVKTAVEHMTPVILLSDGYIGTSSQAWKIPAMDELPEIKIPHRINQNGWTPYVRDPETLVRSWEIPGTPAFEHRIGGLEKDVQSGCVSYDANNHEVMVNIREEKINRIANNIPDLEVEGDQAGDILLVGWGGTYGAIETAARQLRREGFSIGHAHFTWINPLPKNTEKVLSRYDNIIVCELNLGQLSLILRNRFPKFRYDKLTKIKGLPFMVQDIKEKVYKRTKHLVK
ncbi:MAG: 2-oxoacid:acceptor oxidoreductase subunit alpha [Bacteroidia bacterium]